MGIIIFAIAAIAATAAASSLTSPLEGYIAVPMVWRSVNTTDGSDVAINGTTQEIHSQLAVMPDVELNAKDVSPDSSDSLTPEPSLVPRSKFRINCWIGGSGDVPNQRLQAGINYLRQFPGPCVAAPGPRVCTRISCSWNTAIWFCNDTPDELQHSCADLASYADDIRRGCRYFRNREWHAQGQELDTEKFNVIVGKDYC